MSHDSATRLATPSSLCLHARVGDTQRYRARAALRRPCFVAALTVAVVARGPWLYRNQNARTPSPKRGDSSTPCVVISSRLVSPLLPRPFPRCLPRRFVSDRGVKQRHLPDDANRPLAAVRVECRAQAVGVVTQVVEDAAVVQAGEPPPPLPTGRTTRELLRTKHARAEHDATAAQRRCEAAKRLVRLVGVDRGAGASRGNPKP